MSHRLRRQSHYCGACLAIILLASASAATAQEIPDHRHMDHGATGGMSKHSEPAPRMKRKKPVVAVRENLRRRPAWIMGR